MPTKAYCIRKINLPHNIAETKEEIYPIYSLYGSHGR